MKGPPGPGGGAAPGRCSGCRAGGRGAAELGKPREEARGAGMLRRAALLKDTAESRAGGDTRV